MSPTETQFCLVGTATRLHNFQDRLHDRPSCNASSNRFATGVEATTDNFNESVLVSTPNLFTQKPVRIQPCRTQHSSSLRADCSRWEFQYRRTDLSVRMFNKTFKQRARFSSFSIDMHAGHVETISFWRVVHPNKIFRRVVPIGYIFCGRIPTVFWCFNSPMTNRRHFTFCANGLSNAELLIVAFACISHALIPKTDSLVVS